MPTSLNSRCMTLDTRQRPVRVVICLLDQTQLLSLGLIQSRFHTEMKEMLLSKPQLIMYNRLKCEVLKKVKSWIKYWAPQNILQLQGPILYPIASQVADKPEVMINFEKIFATENLVLMRQIFQLS